jgi:hypothetical protein
MSINQHKVAIITAFLAVVGGALSGGITAYSQRSTDQEKFSIQRAEMFEKLIEKLKNKETARMALLILWQLYPDERDQKIIVVAAIESGQPDLIETLIGFDDELKQLAGILHAKAVASGPNAKGSALQTLIKIDPIKAAGVMVDFIREDIRLKGDRYLANEVTIELIQLAKTDQNVAAEVRARANELSPMPFLLDYILYTVGEESEFVERMVNGYKTRQKLELLDEFLGNGNFREDDANEIFDSAITYVVSTLGRDIQKDDFDLLSALAGLRNSSFQSSLASGNNQVLIDKLFDTVIDSKGSDRVRAASLALLRKLSIRKTLFAVSHVLSDGDLNRQLRRQIEQQISKGLIRSYERKNPESKGPQHCLNVDAKECVDDAKQWTAWNQEVANQ